MRIQPAAVRMDLDSHPDSQIISRLHSFDVLPHQTSSVFVKRIRASPDVVWSILRRFDEPQLFKPFVQTCYVPGGVKEGCVREVSVKFGLPATTSSERLDVLDDANHILAYTILDGDHRLKNSRSIISVHSDTRDEKPWTLVVTSYLVDIPDGNTEEETQLFIETFLKCNMKRLADVCEHVSA